MHLVIRCLCCAALLLAPVHALAIVNGEEPAEDDTRFDAVAAFSQTKWLTHDKKDNKAHTWFGNAVLIAPDVVLFANHLVPAKRRDILKPNDYMVRFRRHADGTLGSVDAGPDSFHQVPIAQIIFTDRVDLALGILAKPVEHIEPVKMHLDGDPIEQQKCYLAGWGSESPWRGVKQPRNGLRVGTNTMSAGGPTVKIHSYKTESRRNDEGKSMPYIIDENTVPNMHDSGGSFFREGEDGELILCGIISNYTAGPYLPYADTEQFPLEAAAEGGRALLAALKEARSDPGDEPER